MARAIVSQLTLKSDFDAEAPQRAKVGDVVYSTLTEAQFQALRDTTWVLMDGRDVTGSDYDTIALSGLGGTIPDARGQFLRAKNNGRSDGNQDPDGERGLGAFQNHAMDSHGHDTRYNTATPGAAGGPHVAAISGGGQPNATWASNYDFVSQTLRGTNSSTETRPRNIAVNIFIKINN